MRLREITVDKSHLMLETMIHAVALDVYSLLEEIRHISDNFVSLPQDILTLDEIGELKQIAATYLKTSAEYMGVDSQTNILITKMISYLNTGF